MAPVPVRAGIVGAAHVVLLCAPAHPHDRTEEPAGCGFPGAHHRHVQHRHVQPPGQRWVLKLKGVII